MGRWVATERVMILGAASVLIGSEAFFLPALPCGGTSPSSTSAVAGRANTPLANQPVARFRVASVRGQRRTSRTRVCARPLDDNFSNEADYDQFLGELVFSQSDVRDDVLKNLDKAGDEGFLAWLEKKIEDCDDLEERVGLKSLLDIIKKVKGFVDKALAEEEAEKAAAAEAGDKKEGAVDAEVVGVSGEKRTNAQVWEEMRRLQRLGVEAKAGEEAGDALEALKEAQMSPFEGLPKKAQEAAGTAEAAGLTLLGDTINNAMQQRMSKATERLQRILGSGNPQNMEKTISAMAERGEVDDALVLLLQANLQQAEEADAGPAIAVLKRLGEAAQAVLDEKVDPEKRLVRQLLRAKDRDSRIAILTNAFRQKAKVVLTDGTETSDAPDVTPPKFIEAVKGIIRNFGNVGESELGFAQRLDDMISEAEEVATDLYGETQSPQDMQDRAWKDTTVSVFDLENMEEEGKLRGEEMPWANDQYDGMTPEMVKNFKKDSDGNLQIGGS
eukprot:g10854.t1